MYEGSLFSTPSSAFTVCRFLNDSHLTSVRSYLILALTCVFLVIGDAEHLLMCLLAICMPSLEKCLFRPYVNFLIGLFVCLFVFNSELHELFIYFGDKCLVGCIV